MLQADLGWAACLPQPNTLFHTTLGMAASNPPPLLSTHPVIVHVVMVSRAHVIKITEHWPI